MMDFKTKNLQHISLGAGCFWCLEAAILRCPGVLSVQSGYANSSVSHPTYEAVCQGETGAAEVVQVGFDEAQVSLEQILAVFWAVHDPTSLNRQGADEGTQYRSALYAHDDAMLQRLQHAARQAQAAYEQPIVTEVMRLQNFTPAEPEHHRYFERNPNRSYCVWVVAPKLQHSHAALGKLALNQPPIQLVQQPCASV